MTMQVRVVMAMTKNEQYWSDRFERLKRREMAKADTLTAGTARMYQETLEKLRKDVIDWYVRYADENGLSLADAQKQLDAREMKAFKMKLEHYITLAKKKGLPERYQKMLEQASIRVRLDRSQQIYIQTAHHIEMLANRQNLDLTELLTNVYGDSYYRTAYETQQMKGFSPFRQIGQEQIDAAISKPWAPDGKDFSSRIWENKDQLIQNLHLDLTRALMTGGGTTAIAEGIAKRMNTSFFNARRLIETETAYVQEKAAFDCYKELDVEQYQILAVLDRKTSRICRKLDGKVFAVKDAKPGVTMPPFHCHCRTTTVPYLEELEGIETTRAARDPDTGKTVFVEGDMTYEKWYNKYVKEPSSETGGGSGTVKAEERVVQNEHLKSIVDNLKADNVEYLKPIAYSGPIDETSVIKALAGDDRTTGSCVSLGLAYVGRLSGLDVLDFRGGRSQEIFSQKATLKKVIKFPGINAIVETARSEITVGNKLLKQVEAGKQYYFVAGQHAAIVRKADSGALQYLELQSDKLQGWHIFNGNPRYTLSKRFGCRNGRGRDEMGFMIDIEEMKRSEEIKTLLGYINTAAENEMKGEGGSVK